MNKERKKENNPGKEERREDGGKVKNMKVREEEVNCEERKQQ